VLLGPGTACDTPKDFRRKLARKFRRIFFIFMSSGIEQARRHASKLALVFVLIAFVLAIVVFFTPFWYKVSYNSVLGSVTFSAGLIQTRTCDSDCSSQSFPDDEEGDYRSARLTAIICMSLAFFFTVLYFLATGLQISGKVTLFLLCILSYLQNIARRASRPRKTCNC